MANKIMAIELGTRSIIKLEDGYHEKIENKYDIPLVLNAGGLQKARQLGIVESASLRELYQGDYGDDGFCTKVLYIGYLGANKNDILSLEDFSYKLLLEPDEILEKAYKLVFPELSEHSDNYLKEIEENTKNMYKQLEQAGEDISKKKSEENDLEKSTD